MLIKIEDYIPQLDGVLWKSPHSFSDEEKEFLFEHDKQRIEVLMCREKLHMIVEFDPGKPGGGCDTCDHGHPMFIFTRVQ